MFYLFIFKVTSEIMKRNIYFTFDFLTIVLIIFLIIPILNTSFNFVIIIKLYPVNFYFISNCKITK